VTGTGSGPSAMVVGARGFIGTHLTAALRELGVPTVEVTRSTAADLGAGLRRTRTIFYLAGSVTPQTAEAESGRVLADQAALATFLGSCQRHGNRPTFVLVSSGGTIYDPVALPPYAESAPARPATAYGRAKLALERQALSAADSVRPLVLRLSNVYGPGQQARDGLGVIAHWLAAARDGTHPVLFGDPEVKRDYVFVADVAQALARVCVLQAAAGRISPPIINVGSGVPVSAGEILRTVCSVVGQRLVPVLEPARGFDRRDVWLDVTRAAEALDWRPATLLGEGIERTWQAIANSSRADAGRPTR
jgi:UDP-glucose 4-epimerase